MKRRTFLSVAAVVPLAVAGCTGSGTPPETTPSNGTPTTGGQEPAGDSQLKMLIGQPETPEDLAATEESIQRFRDMSGIDVEVDMMPDDTLRTVLQTQLRSGAGPDLFGYDTGPGFAGALASAGLLYDMSQDYESRDWPIFEFARERVRFDGKLMGIPDQLETIGLFYNKPMFDELGIQEPQTFQELMDACEQLKNHGVIPMGVSDQEGWQGGHLLSMSLASIVGSARMEAMINGDEPWNTDEGILALQMWDDMRQAGYLTPSPAGISYDNGNALFYNGEAAINPTGSWMVSRFEANTDFEVGYMPFPGPDGPGIFCGGLGGGMFISASSNNVESALEYLDWFMTPERGRWQVEKLLSIPAFPVDIDGLEAPPLFKQVLEDTAQIAEGTGDFGHNIDVLTTDVFNDAMWNGIQALLTGQRGAEQVAEELQSAAEEG